MIVVDTNILAALVLPIPDRSEEAERLLEHDRDWAVPLLWRSELANILTTGIRNGWFELDQALTALETAEDVVRGAEFAVPTEEVVRLAARSGCTGYDSEFALLAEELGVKLVTLDRQLLKAFPERAVEPGHLLAGKTDNM